MDLYVPVSSKFTSNYMRNKPWNFTVKLNVNLPGDGWKVRIVYAMLPPMKLLNSLQSARENLIELHLVSKKTSQPDQVNVAVLKGSDLSTWESGKLCTTGLEFFNTIKHHLEQKLQQALWTGYQYTKQTWQTLEWVKEGYEPELVIKPGDKGNKLIISKQLSNLFGWIHQHTWSNLVYSYPQKKKGKSSFDTDQVIDRSQSETYGLSTLSEWRFINVNQSFNQACNLTPRPLTVAAFITLEGGRWVEQELGVIDYAPNGRTETMYVPDQDMFYPVVSSKWGEVLFTVKEWDYNDVPFVSSPHLYLILHFQQATM